MYNSWCLIQWIEFDHRSNHVPMQHLHMRPELLFCIQYPMQQYHFVRIDCHWAGQLGIRVALHHRPKWKEIKSFFILMKKSKKKQRGLCACTYLTRIDPLNTTSTYKWLIQSEFSTQSWCLQFGLASCKFNNAQWYTFHDDTVDALLAKNIFTWKISGRIFDSMNTQKYTMKNKYLKWMVKIEFEVDPLTPSTSKAILLIWHKSGRWQTNLYL